MPQCSEKNTRSKMDQFFFNCCKRYQAYRYLCLWLMRLTVSVLSFALHQMASQLRQPNNTLYFIQCTYM